MAWHEAYGCGRLLAGFLFCLLNSFLEKDQEKGADSPAFLPKLLSNLPDQDINCILKGGFQQAVISELVQDYEKSQQGHNNWFKHTQAEKSMVSHTADAWLTGGPLQKGFNSISSLIPILPMPAMRLWPSVTQKRLPTACMASPTNSLIHSFPTPTETFSSNQSFCGSSDSFWHRIFRWWRGMRYQTGGCACIYCYAFHSCLNFASWYRTFNRGSCCLPGVL